MDKLKIKVAIQISKSAEKVYEAIVNPEQMKNYFISKGSARLENGKTVYWQFPEFPIDIPVRVKTIRPHNLIHFAWDASSGEELMVKIALEQLSNGSTVVRVEETGMTNNEAGLAWLTGNTEGWANFLACLKAWMEYQINLRRGAFDFMVSGNNT
ncbi:MAG: SRPBCC domain-containing protein [Prevotella sp.]|nr:SRPBCC domain-containing protein [Prevotella sp.]